MASRQAMFSIVLLVLSSAGTGALAALEELPLTDEINGVKVPPSPADIRYYPGHHLYDLPAITHWPAIIYADEQRNCAFHLPVPQPEAQRIGPQRKKRDPATQVGSNTDPDPPPPSDPRMLVGWQGGDRGTVGWVGGPQLALSLPSDPEITRVSGLLDLPEALGLHQAEVRIAEGRHGFSLRLVDAGEPWPLAALRNGFPVDADGVPVVLVSQRIDPAEQRRWELLRSQPRRPDGPILVVGDPLASPGGDSWTGLREQAICRQAVDDRFPHHASLVALAGFAEGIGRGAGQDKQVPRTIVWSPGNNSLHANTWTREESRLLDLVRRRCQQLGQLPRLILALPPMPVERRLQEQAVERRAHLRTRASFTDWEVIDCQRVLRDFPDANEIAPGATTRYPYGDAQRHLAAQLAAFVSD